METMKGLHRTHHCGTIGAEQVGTEVVLCGWVERLWGCANRGIS